MHETTTNESPKSRPRRASRALHFTAVLLALVALPALPACGTLMRQALGGGGGGGTEALASGVSRAACADVEPGSSEPAAEPAEAPTPTLRVERSGLLAGRLTAGARRGPDADAHAIEEACRSGALSSAPIAELEVVDAARLRIAVHLEERAARRVALREAGGATRCVDARGGAAVWSRAVPAGRYEVLTDLSGAGRFAVVVSRAR